MTPKYLFLLFVVIIIWGGNVIAIKVGCGEFPPIFFTALRFFLVALLLVPLRPRRGDKTRPLLWLALVMGVGHFGMLFLGISGLNASTASIIMQTSAPFAALLATWFYKDRLGWVGWSGMALAFVGVAVIYGEPAKPDPFYLFVILCASLGWAASNIIVKGMTPVDPLMVTGWMAAFCAPMLLALSLATESGQIEAMMNATIIGWGAVIYTAVLSSILSYGIWYYLLGRLPVNRVAPFNLLTPVVAIAGGGLLLGEAMGLPTIIGAAMTIIGVAVIQMRPSS